MSPAKPRLLLTGAAGVLGSDLVRRLAADYRLVVLVNRTPVGARTAVTVRGNVSEERLGLSRGIYDDLVGGLDAIVHAAAATDFSTDRATMFETNVTGTARILDLAERSEAKLVHVSTAFVECRGHGVADAVSPDAYLESKLRAEQLIAERGYPTVVARPSVIAGDSETGAVARLQGLHVTGAAVAHGELPLIPVEADAVVDFVPTDVVAEAIRILLRSSERRVYWLTAGKHAVAAADLVRIAVAAGERVRGEPVIAPRLMPQDVLRRLVLPLLTDVGPEHLRARLKQFLAHSYLFESGRIFPSDLAALGLAERVTHAKLLAGLETGMAYVLK
ncbi:SDR family oxidoreductase [Nocardia brasiliensis]|uniref:SDR family oxidoreductase n=1 Tax=Nocardia brasiliensis TaxID=37326 RepID=UPI00366A9191